MQSLYLQSKQSLNGIIQSTNKIDDGETRDDGAAFSLFYPPGGGARHST